MSENNYKEGDIVCYQYDGEVGCFYSEINYENYSSILSLTPIAYWRIKKLK